jgi:hypothetical protein
MLEEDFQLLMEIFAKGNNEEILLACSRFFDVIQNKVQKAMPLEKLLLKEELIEIQARVEEEMCRILLSTQLKEEECLELIESREPFSERERELIREIQARCALGKNAQPRKKSSAARSYV